MKLIDEKLMRMADGTDGPKMVDGKTIDEVEKADDLVYVHCIPNTYRQRDGC